MRQHHAGDGLLAAARSARQGLDEVLHDFRKLNTREARAAFADHWIGLWANDFDKAWPMLYELLKIIDEDQLYKDPRRVGPRAPGTSHAPTTSYPDFASYFSERVKKPLEHWAELEATYNYAKRYAPKLLESLFPEANTARLAHHGGDRHSVEFKEAQRLLTHGGKRQVDVINLKGGTQPTYICARLERDAEHHKDPVKREQAARLLPRVQSGEITPHAAAIEAGWRRRLVQIQPTVNGFIHAAERHLSPEQRLQLKEAL